MKANWRSSLDRKRCDIVLANCAAMRCSIFARTALLMRWGICAGTYRSALPNRLISSRFVYTRESWYVSESRRGPRKRSSAGSEVMFSFERSSDCTAESR